MGFYPGHDAKVGVSPRFFVGLIMKCVKSVKYHIKVNNELTEIIIPGRGLRQGDPLSPYVFLICAEGFSSLMHQAKISNHIQGIKVCNGAPSVSHLLFADSLILMKAIIASAHHLNYILDLYEACSGQKINKEKSSIMFSRNVCTTAKEEMKQILQLSSEAMTDKYLGLPIHIGCSKEKAFSYLKKRTWKRIQGWRERLLSVAGKEILIKAVTQAIPTYAMSCFDLTKSFCEPKDEGGMGFRDLYAFNLAMLAKQGWRIIQNQNSFCAQILKAKYFPDGDILHVKAKAGASYT
jgi:hypothetical protein